MRPILMKGHERPLTYLKYNREGDVLFSCARDRTPAVWYADTGKLLGTYNGHTGAVWCCDVSWDSKLLITASADQTTKLWDVQAGAELFTFQFKSTAKSVEFSVGDKLAVIATDSFSTGLPSAIHVKHIASDPSEQCGDSVIEFSPGGRSNRAVWGPLNRTILTGGDGAVRVWDVETMTLINESDKETGHQKAVTSLIKSVDGSHLLTGSLDKSAKLWDIRSMKLVRTYKTDCPVNAVSLSPLLDHVVLGGGPEASSVTNDSRAAAAMFEAKFFHKVLEEKIGTVKGHFGPINALAFNPDGKSFSSGGEDGYVRLHHFDQDYFNIAI
ncbi:eukaryotic translation initiation factor 3 subunit I-like [Apium graveolens]|uniref:eukaryotic translation initiation factor 3 subunit I-like n=1 Tax=Apium graveolens TaxID=4045 RepID=UPI003D7A4DD8